MSAKLFRGTGQVDCSDASLRHLKDMRSSKDRSDRTGGQIEQSTRALRAFLFAARDTTQIERNSCPNDLGRQHSAK
ncbi:MAG: hypothetical protein DCC58_02455 [Chloroflexi bacterium]|nr:MAG: hypothetical protein DCC58_02455 [Chloroflexota bacterium]